MVVEPKAVPSSRPTPARAPPVSVPAHRGSPQDGGDSLFVLFIVAMLVMVVAIAAVGIIDTWWVLALVMVVDLVAATAVLADIVRLLRDDGER